MIIPLVVGGVLALLVLAASVRIVNQYERGVLLRLGRYIGTREPGLNFIVPFIDKMIKVDLRVVTQNIPAQEVITKDNVPIKVDAVIYYRVVDPVSAVLNVEDYEEAVFNLAQTTLRSVLGEVDLDDILAKREELSERIREIIDEKTEGWGIHVTGVEIRDVILPEEMRRAIARQAEAERDRRARVIQAEAEKQAAQDLRKASEVLGVNPGLLRTLQTLSEVSAEENVTIVIPVPIELLKLLKEPE
ncbi:slipin family protein [Methanopyrus kandleri]|uniref:Membrane protease subunit, stomatin/prohibitin homolog n=1 Tax=Methanopyrus kandleri (strain AV19 / DSM 6324 / JCM 9639 / NBRC 100938) TaxID=190192 RepID=Q8TX31_METKA|nr:slipin family protein [Methanopyrus kandleri]AAM02060.1 Membrane protease subunit, stomatin/prohibitin homolog [Methanopyrus kandleri AV19]